jgi:hypothetical protein
MRVAHCLFMLSLIMDIPLKHSLNANLYTVEHALTHKVFVYCSISVVLRRSPFLYSYPLYLPQSSNRSTRAAFEHGVYLLNCIIAQLCLLCNCRCTNLAHTLGNLQALMTADNTHDDMQRSDSKEKLVRCFILIRF